MRPVKILESPLKILEVRWLQRFLVRADLKLSLQTNAEWHIHKGKYVFFNSMTTISTISQGNICVQIELFFKWIKQHLKIKKFWGTSENAVRIQIYSAIIDYCMMAIVQKKMTAERSIYEMLQIVSISLTDTTNPRDLFAKANYNIVNELDDSTEPNLFNC